MLKSHAERELMVRNKKKLIAENYSIISAAKKMTTPMQMDIKQSGKTRFCSKIWQGYLKHHFIIS